MRQEPPRESTKTLFFFFFSRPLAFFVFRSRYHLPPHFPLSPRGLLTTRRLSRPSQALSSFPSLSLCCYCLSSPPTRERRSCRPSRASPSSQWPRSAALAPSRREGMRVRKSGSSIRSACSPLLPLLPARRARALARLSRLFLTCQRPATSRAISREQLARPETAPA